MTIPAVMFIEMALDSLKTLDPVAKSDQVKEFRMLGEARIEEARKAVGNASYAELGCSDLELGYLIGLQTARTLLAGMPNAVINDVRL